MTSNGVPGSRLNLPCKAISSTTGISMIHAIVTKPGSKVSFKIEPMLGYGTAWKTTHIKDIIVAQPTKQSSEFSGLLGINS